MSGRDVVKDLVETSYASHAAERAAIGRIHAQTDVIRGSNDLCRSMLLVADRKGEATDWDALAARLRQVILDQDAILVGSFEAPPQAANDEGR